MIAMMQTLDFSGKVAGFCVDFGLYSQSRITDMVVFEYLFLYRRFPSSTLIFDTENVAKFYRIGNGSYIF